MSYQADYGYPQPHVYPQPIQQQQQQAAAATDSHHSTATIGSTECWTTSEHH